MRGRPLGLPFLGEKMKKTLVFLTIAAFLLTAACGRKEPAPVSASPVSEEVSVSVSESVSESIEEVSVSEETPRINEAPDIDTVVELYADYLKNIYESNVDSMHYLRYDLVYVDDDDIPELVYMEDNYHAATVHMIMAYTDGAFEIGEFGENGSFSYVPSGGKILSFYMGMGSYLYDFYSLEDRTLQEDKYFERAEIMDDSERFYIDGDEVDEDTYTAEYAKMNVDKYVVCDYMGAIGYEQSYDVKDILRKYASTRVKPAAIEVTDEIKALEGEYTATCFALYKNPAGPMDENMYCNVRISDDGHISADFGIGDTAFTDDSMPVTEYKDALSTVEDGSLFAVCAMSDDCFREYMCHSMPDGTIKLCIFDSGAAFENSSFYFVLEKNDEDQ